MRSCTGAPQDRRGTRSVAEAAGRRTGTGADGTSAFPRDWTPTSGPRSAPRCIPGCRYRGADGHVRGSSALAGLDTADVAVRAPRPVDPLTSTDNLGITVSAPPSQTPLANVMCGPFNPGFVVQQQTLRDSAAFSGIGLHSGDRVRMTFLPAPPDTGIRFRRVDLDGQPEIPARLDNVVETTRSTTLGSGSVRVQTVEHVLAAFRRLRRGQRRRRARRRRAAHRRRQCARVLPDGGRGGGGAAGGTPPGVRRDAPLELNAGESLMTVFPHDRLKITCTSADRRGGTRSSTARRSRRTPGAGTGPGPHLLLLRGDRVPDPQRLDQGRQPPERHRDPRRRGPHHRAVAVRRRVCPAQDAGHSGGSLAAGAARWRATSSPSCPVTRRTSPWAAGSRPRWTACWRRCAPFRPPPEPGATSPAAASAETAVVDGATLDIET